MSDDQIFSLAESVRAYRLSWESPREGEYDELDFAKLLSTLSFEQRVRLEDKLENYTWKVEKPRIISMIKLAAGNSVAWEEWANSIRTIGSNSQRLNLEVPLLVALDERRRSDILEQLVRNYSELSKKSSVSDLAPQRAVTYVIKTLVRPYDIFLQHPGRPDFALKVYLERMEKLVGKQTLSSEKILKFLWRIQKFIRSERGVGSNEYMLFYGSLLNGTFGPTSDIDLMQNFPVRLDDLQQILKEEMGPAITFDWGLSGSHISVTDALDFASSVSPVGVLVEAHRLTFIVNKRHSGFYDIRERLSLQPGHFVLE